MNKRRSITLEITLIIALIALSGLTVFGNPVGGPETLRLTGRLYVIDHMMDDMILVVELDGERCGYVELHPNGKFDILVPVGAEVLLQFSKPGHLSKEVRLNTLNAMKTHDAKKANKVVEFDVVMETKETRKGRAYKGPVGSLSFVNGTGTMKVQHHPSLVAEP